MEMKWSFNFSFEFSNRWRLLVYSEDIILEQCEISWIRWEWTNSCSDYLKTKENHWLNNRWAPLEIEKKSLFLSSCQSYESLFGAVTTTTTSYNILVAWARRCIFLKANSSLLLHRLSILIGGRRPTRALIGRLGEQVFTCETHVWRVLDVVSFGLPTVLKLKLKYYFSA